MGLTIRQMESLLKSKQKDDTSYADPIELLKDYYGEGYYTPSFLYDIQAKVFETLFDDDKPDKLMVSLPPRSGKSLYISTALPAWYIDKAPHNRVILASHGQRLAEDFARDARDLFDEYCTHDLKQTLRKSNQWGVEKHRGGLIAVGVGSSVTGKGGDLIIIDDPVKDDADAISDLKMDRLNKWYKGTLYTRRQPGAKIILLGTRWSEIDLHAQLLENEDDEWAQLVVPALTKIGDSYHSYFPEMWSTEDLLQTKETMGSFFFAAEYCQNPKALDAGVLKKGWLTYYNPSDLPTRDSGQRPQRVTAIDLAISTKASADRTVICTVDAVGNEFFIRNMYGGRWAFPEAKENIRSEWGFWAPDNIFTEQVSYQKSMQEQLNIEYPDMNVQTIVNTGAGVKSKEARIMELVPLFENQRIHIPENAPWFSVFLDEYVSFPRGRHDDYLDALHMAISKVKNAGSPYTASDRNTPYYMFSDGAKERRGQRPLSHNPYSTNVRYNMKEVFGI